MSALAGRRVAVTRAAAQAPALADALRACGARVVLFPTIEIRPVTDAAAVRAAVATLETYAWVVFTSANAVRWFADHLATRPEGRIPRDVRVAAVGTATAAALGARALRVDAVPTEFVGVRIASVLGDVRGRRVLLPRADIGRPETADALRTAGALVDEVTVYHTLPASPDPEGLAALRAGVDAITFTAPSTFTNFAALLGAETGAVLRGVVVAAIGPVTSAAIRAAGFRVHVEPAEHTITGLVDALETFWASHTAGVAGATP